MSDMSLLVDDDLLNDDYFVSPADIVMTETDEKANKKISFIKVLFCVLCFILLGELVVPFSGKKIIHRQKSLQNFCR